MPPNREKNAETRRELAAAMSTLAGRPPPTGQRPLTGRERAAVLMLALGEQSGGKIWSMLDDDELRDLSVAISGIGAIDLRITIGNSKCCGKGSWSAIGQTTMRCSLVESSCAVTFGSRIARSRVTMKSVSESSICRAISGST